MMIKYIYNSNRFSTQMILQGSLPERYTIKCHGLNTDSMELHVYNGDSENPDVIIRKIIRKGDSISIGHDNINIFRDGLLIASLKTERDNEEADAVT